MEYRLSVGEAECYYTAGDTGNKNKAGTMDHGSLRRLSFLATTPRPNIHNRLHPLCTHYIKTRKLTRISRLSGWKILGWVQTEILGKTENLTPQVICSSSCSCRSCNCTIQILHLYSAADGQLWEKCVSEWRSRSNVALPVMLEDSTCMSTFHFSMHKILQGSPPLYYLSSTESKKDDWISDLVLFSFMHA